MFLLTKSNFNTSMLKSFIVYLFTSVLLYMPVNFDSNGNLSPYDKLEFNLIKLKETFVNDFPSSSTRQQLFEGLNRYRDELFNEINLKIIQWLGGSFITKKLDPLDIDLANLIPFNDKMDLNIERLIPFMTVGGSVDIYGIDGYLIPIYMSGDERFENTQLRLKYFSDWFGHDRNDNQKGFVEIKVL